MNKEPLPDYSDEISDEQFAAIQAYVDANRPRGQVLTPIGKPGWGDDLWVPQCKDDIVNLLFKVQTGHVSCRFASDVLFPQWASSDEANKHYGEMLRREKSDED